MVQLVTETLLVSEWRKLKQMELSVSQRLRKNKHIQVKHLQLWKKPIPIYQKYGMYMKQTAVLVGSRTCKCCRMFIV